MLSARVETNSRTSFSPTPLIVIITRLYNAFRCAMVAMSRFIITRNRKGPPKKVEITENNHKKSGRMSRFSSFQLHFSLAIPRLSTRHSHDCAHDDTILTTTFETLHFIRAIFPFSSAVHLCYAACSLFRCM
ncbi:hypothetical protein EXIGLDRAFT_172228 [Exidia glandulosa HHB12029]|uniref:Uncharacterized protein n=1 Tax=Exidia glandulosa HHB12029 TaxID=1314781 RepID=A0A165FA24_EXIGL|nr:hypothetical protein EXIGLDRAFT_172228 [Exidia glandulosa HHB12029]